MLELSSYYIFFKLSFLTGWLADKIWGDPKNGFHPIVLFGKLIAAGEKKWNKGLNRRQKGAYMAISYILLTILITFCLLYFAKQISPYLSFILIAVGVFYCLAGKTLIKEVKEVFKAVEESTEKGRKQLSRIVGRDTQTLSPQEIKLAALETLAENLSDGVIAPMFWFLIGGLPAMMGYKMINTLDSMIGYKNDRYRDFGCIAAKIDDIANFIPARLTAICMLFVSGNLNKYNFVRRFGRAHASPNSGYPEAALAGILDCRFGGTHDYFGKPVEKPYIGTNDREITFKDMTRSISICENTELLIGITITVISICIL